MDKFYNSKLIIHSKKNFARNQGFFISKINKPICCIMAPPPNITGELHMGHAYQCVLIDMIIRYNKINNINVFCQWGTDHAGIATQMIVEKNIKNKDIFLNKLSKDNLLNYTYGWKKFFNHIIKNQLNKIDILIDWDKECFTLNDDLSNSVIFSFALLYKHGLIYRGNKIINWDPILCSAVSDMEVNYRKILNKIWYIKYYVIYSNNFLIISTTRPETIVNDIAIALNIKDYRYKYFINKIIILPFFNRYIPIITDDYIDKHFGSGCLKITPSQSFIDYEIGEKHLLPKINIIYTNVNYYCSYINCCLTPYKLRHELIKYFKSSHMLEKSEDHIISMPISNRTSATLEPILTNQWFLKIRNLSYSAIKIIVDKKLKILPYKWENYYVQWINSLHDWCISRQLWWGHKIPIWYDNDKKYLGICDKEIRLCYNLNNSLILHNHQDVLDTWFSSALWPLSTLGWPNTTLEFINFYPFNLLVTGFDIISFWVSKMIIFGIYFTGYSPFCEIYIHGLLQDSVGDKMSKTKGNTMDPMDIIYGVNCDILIKKKTKNLIYKFQINKVTALIKYNFKNGIKKYGVDALRFALCSFNNKSRYIKFNLIKIENYYNFCNKIWNMSYYILNNSKFNARIYYNNPKLLFFSSLDKHILSIWQKTKMYIIYYFSKYRFGIVIKYVYDFIYNDFCSWYIENSKVVFKNIFWNSRITIAVKYILILILQEIICIVNIIAPHIGNDILLNLYKFFYEYSIFFDQKLPFPNLLFINFYTESELHYVKYIIDKIRRLF